MELACRSSSDSTAHLKLRGLGVRTLLELRADDGALYTVFYETPICATRILTIQGLVGAQQLGSQVAASDSYLFFG